jgi:IclR family pca regulon transcriptional regulator
MGKAMLAFLPDDERNAAIERVQFSRLGPNTRTSRQALLKDLERVRTTGIAVNDEELAYGLRSIAAPISNRSGEIVAALNLAAHRSMALTDDLIERFSPAVLKTAANISAELA